MHQEGIVLLQSVTVGEPDANVIELEARLRRAQLDANVAELDALISNDLLFTGPFGSLATKREDLNAHGSGAVKVRAHKPEELRIRVLSNETAMTALRARLIVVVGGKEHTGVFQYTRVWAREADDVWRVAGGHVSEVL